MSHQNDEELMTQKSTTIVDLIHEGYRKGKSNLATSSLDWMARSMLEKAKIAKHIDRAKVLRTLVDQSFAKSGKGEFDRKAGHELFSLLSECFDVLIDDLIIGSAFELYAKRMLLSQGYCVHDISLPENLRLAQRGKKGQGGAPVHVNTIKATETKGAAVGFGETTLSLSILMSKPYANRLNLPADAMRGLAEVRERRNLVHFHTHLTWNVTSDLLALVEYLDKAIPTCDVLRKRGRRNLKAKTDSSQ